MKIAMAPLLVLFLGVHAWAAELQVGQQYTSGQRVASVSDGVSFIIPDEWLGGLPPDAAAFLLGSHTRAGVGMVIMRAATTWQEIETFLNQPQDLGDGVVLSPTGPGQRSERGYEIGFANPIYVGHGLGRIGNEGNGVIVFFGGPAGQLDHYVQLAASIADSIVFSAPRATAAREQWRDFLAGMMLVRMSSYYSGGPGGAYVGGSSSQTLHLCSDGSYAYFARSSVAADGGGGVSGHSAGQGGEFGQWEVELIGARVLLNLRSLEGAISQHLLRVQGDTTYFNGERTYRVRSDRCH
jgi:hypothetical protein